MLLRLSQLSSFGIIDKIVIHSIDQSLYQASVEVEGVEFYISDNQGKLLRSVSVAQMQKKLQALTSHKMVLRHESPYDEMIGQEEKIAGQNRLEVDLMNHDAPTLT